MAKEDNMMLFRIEDNVGIITLNRPDKAECDQLGISRRVVTIAVVPAL